MEHTDIEPLHRSGRTVTCLNIWELRSGSFPRDSRMCSPAAAFQIRTSKLFGARVLLRVSIGAGRTHQAWLRGTEFVGGFSVSLRKTPQLLFSRWAASRPGIKGPRTRQTPAKPRGSLHEPSSFGAKEVADVPGTPVYSETHRRHYTYCLYIDYYVGTWRAICYYEATNRNCTFNV